MPVFAIVILSVFGVLLLLYVVTAVVVYVFAITPPHRTSEQMREEELISKGVPAELYDIPYEELWLDSDHGYKIFVREYRANEGNLWAVLVHGHNAASSNMVRNIRVFLEHGFNLLLPDNRYSARTGGFGTTFGRYEKDDVGKCVDFALAQSENAVVGVMGESMGGATVLLVAGERQELAFCVDYCGYADMRDEIKTMAKHYFAPAVLTVPLVDVMIRLTCGFRMREVRPEESVKKMNCPLLVLHSKSDNVVPYSHAERILANAPHAEHVAFEKSLHGHSQTMYPELYDGAIAAFLEKLGFAKIDESDKL